MAPKRDFVVSAKNVYKIYRMGESEVRALDGVSLDIERGSCVSIMGPSGSGKTTLLDVMTCLLRPTSGEVCVNGKTTSEMSDSQLARIRGKTIGFVFQTFNLIPRLSALENVMLPLWFEGIPGGERKKIAEKVLGDVGLAQRMRHRPTELSGGERQRVAIARALANNPDVIVADEPTGNLDTKAGNQVMGIIDNLNSEQGKTVLIVTHDPAIEKFAGRNLRILDGKLIN